MNNSFVFNKKDNTSCMICVQRTQVNPLEHQSLLMELLMAQELQAVKNLPRIKLVKFFTVFIISGCCLSAVTPSVVILPSNHQLEPHWKSSSLTL